MRNYYRQYIALLAQVETKLVTDFGLTLPEAQLKVEEWIVELDEGDPNDYVGMGWVDSRGMP